MLVFVKSVFRFILWCFATQYHLNLFFNSMNFSLKRKFYLLTDRHRLLLILNNNFIKLWCLSLFANLILYSLQFHYIAITMSSLAKQFYHFLIFYYFLRINSVIFLISNLFFNLISPFFSKTFRLNHYHHHFELFQFFIFPFYL